MYYHVSSGNRFCISVQCSDFALIQAAIWRVWFRIQTVIELKKSVYMLEVLVIEARRINRHITLIFYRSVILGKTFYLHKDSLYDQVYTQTPANSMLILDEELRDKLRQISILTVRVEKKFKSNCASFESTQYLAYGSYLPTDCQIVMFRYSFVQQQPQLK